MPILDTLVALTQTADPSDRILALRDLAVAHLGVEAGVKWLLAPHTALADCPPRRYSMTQPVTCRAGGGPSPGTRTRDRSAGPLLAPTADGARECHGTESGASRRRARARRAYSARGDGDGRVCASKRRPQGRCERETHGDGDSRALEAAFGGTLAFLALARGPALMLVNRAVTIVIYVQGSLSVCAELFLQQCGAAHHRDNNVA